MENLEQKAGIETPFQEQMREFDNLAGNPLDFYRFAARKGYLDEDDIQGTFLTGYRTVFLQGKALADKDKTPTNEQQTKKKRGIVKQETYRSFAEEAGGLSSSSYEHYGSRKRELLVKYFPCRFGDNGAQPVNTYESVKVGAIFNVMIKQARKSCGKKIA